MTVNVQNFLAAQRAARQDLAADLNRMESLYNRKLWHQLTVYLMEFVKRPEFDHGDWLVGLYHCFIVDVETKLNQLSLVAIALRVAEQMPDREACISFLESMNKKIKANHAASVACNMAIADLKLQGADIEACKVLLEQTQEVLDANDDIALDIHAKYYRVAAAYHKLKASYGDYYREALRYLGCVDSSTLPLNVQQDYAFDLGLAAVLSPKLYHFGELIAHPVLESLQGTPRAWMIELLHAFNRGDIVQLDALQGYWQTQPILVEHVVDIRKKMCLMCLVEIVFAHPSDNRSISFETIAENTCLPLNEVEYLVMRALNLKLIRGTIDEVTSTVSVTWVQPRVLDRQQIKGMANRLEQWCDNVENILAMANTTDPELSLRDE